MMSYVLSSWSGMYKHLSNKQAEPQEVKGPYLSKYEWLVTTIIYTQMEISPPCTKEAVEILLASSGTFFFDIFFVKRMSP